MVFLLRLFYIRPGEKVIRKAIVPICLLAFALLTACQRGPKTPSELDSSAGAGQPGIVSGVYPGTTSWLWTSPIFALKLAPPVPMPKPTYLELEFTIPDELIKVAPVITLTAKFNGTEVARQTYNTTGKFMMSARLADGALTAKPAEIEFTVDHSFVEDGKPKSLIFFSAGLKPYSRTRAFETAELDRAQAAYREVLAQRDLKFPVERQKELMRLFHDLPIWETLTFRGVRIIKNPLDLWMLQQIVWEVKPDFVVETGTWQGGSALWWAQTLDNAGLKDARVLTVDIQDLTAAASRQELWRKSVTFELGSSTDPKIVARFQERVKGKRVIVNLDSDHSMRHVLEELKLYAPMVSKGSYIAVEDTHLDGVPTHPEQGPGPMSAVLQFLKEGGSKDFEQDFSRESMVMTSYPGGWLKRK